MPLMRQLTPTSLLLASALCAQDCSIPFTEPLFGVQAEVNLWYGNSTRYNGGTDSLRLNLYKPVGDGQVDRPLVVLIHGGGFYAGHRNDFNALASDLASRGWAAATISYRLGFYGTWLLEPPYAHDPHELRRAIYRAMQDAKGAIRFLKGRSAQDSTSTTSVFLLGGSAGAITALHAVYLDDEPEKPGSANAIGDVQHLLNFYPRPDLGAIDGELHQNGYDASVLGVVNIFGALMDTALVQSSADPALLSYHQLGDPVVGCGVQRPYWGAGLGVADNYPWLHGSCSIDARMQHLGFSANRYSFMLHNGSEHAVHAPDSVIQASLVWMRELMCGQVTSTSQILDADRVGVHPNPSQGLLIAEAAWATQFSIVDAVGKTVLHGSFGYDTPTIDASALRDGPYLLRLIGGDRSSTSRFILAR
ncbi:MAG: carboxylesterase family protein [Flavobacteriales bacterium]|nr:carboxylesterase family protein [Flavobacteriales bacterium]